MATGTIARRFAGICEALMTARGRMIDVSHIATRRERISPRSRLESLAKLDRVLARVPARHTVDRLGLTGADVRGRAVLVNTGWDRHGGSERYFEGHPYLTGELAEWLGRGRGLPVRLHSPDLHRTPTRRA